MRICKYVRLSRQRSWEEGGISGRIVECFHFMTFYLLLSRSEIELEQGGGATAASSLLGNVTAGAGVTELLALDNETAHTWWN